MRAQSHCPHCLRNYRIDFTWEFDDKSYVRFLHCGHLDLVDAPQILFDTFETVSVDNSGQAAWQYQVEGVEFFSKTNGNCLIADEMGLGKTIQALLSARALGKTTLFVVKSATLWQWLRQYKKWCDNKLTGIYMITETKGFIPPGFDSYLISMDTFSRMVRAEKNPYGKVINVSIYPQFEQLPIDFIVVDECQSFKDPSSNRTTALVAYIQHKQIKYKLFLSGTPIKNRADEYFTTLNILDPENFDSIERFRRNWLVQDQKGKWSSIQPYRLESFRELISNYVIRREKQDVLRSLPEFRRTFETISIEDEHMKKIYNQELDRLNLIAGSKEKITWADVGNNLMSLRRITGMAKVKFCVEYIDTFLDTIESEKIAIGIHHTMVRDALYGLLDARGFSPIKLSGEDGSEDKDRKVKEFQKETSRVMVINMLAGGVGMDGLQCCNNVVCLERQWNSVDEEQFESRFHRAGQDKPVLCEYLVAKGTIDDYFMDLVEAKRLVFQQGVSNDWSLASDPNMLRELIERTISSRL